ncbi:MAG: cysteine--tRNA ligase [Ardenticatenales bacterium]|nr:cysteine--tRNA ligase [Ardenticatenales bacterium]
MKLYDSLSRTFKTLPQGHDAITIYVCGVTPYDTTHLGHAYTYLVFDGLIRYLESQGGTVRYVQNVTDIDDDILRKSADLGLTWDELADRETAQFLADLRALNTRMPDLYPKASEETEAMIDIIERLVADELAYVRNGSVYYHVASDPNFGKLSQYDYATMLRTANERGNHPDDPNKEDPLDFVLWQAAQPGEPTWPSPWGAGRPGWHIECSAMAMRHLGPTLDIHGGGADLLFPHHECEIAQSENSSGQRPFVQIWLHIAMVRMEGEKMSKSLGNMVFIRDLLQQYDADAVRAYLYAHHYRISFEWNEAEMAAAARRSATWQRALAHEVEHDDEATVSTLADMFHHAIQEDLNTPTALKVLDELADGILIGQLGQSGQAALAGLSRTIGFRLAV